MKKVLIVLISVMMTALFAGVALSSCGANKKIIHKGADGGLPPGCMFAPGSCR